MKKRYRITISEQEINGDDKHFHRYFCRIPREVDIYQHLVYEDEFDLQRVLQTIVERKERR